MNLDTTFLILAPQSAAHHEKVAHGANTKVAISPNTPIKAPLDHERSEHRAKPNIDAFAPQFRVGDNVEARYNGERAYYPGVVADIDSNGPLSRYVVRFLDGEIEAGIPQSFLRLAWTKEITDLENKTCKLAEGMRIEAMFADSGAWFPGQIMGITGKGSYSVKYDDGDVENEVERNRIRSVGFDYQKTKMAIEAAQGKPVDTLSLSSHDIMDTKYRVGDSVEAMPPKKRKWFSAKIVSIDAGAKLYKVAFSNGSFINHATGTYEEDFSIFMDGISEDSIRPLAISQQWESFMAV